MWLMLFPNINPFKTLHSHLNLGYTLILFLPLTHPQLGAGLTSFPPTSPSFYLFI